MRHARSVLVWLFTALCPAVAHASGPCLPAIRAVEQWANTAPGLLAAIGMVESGRTDPGTGVREPWPWTINAEGAGSYYPTKAAAIAAAQALQARGVRSFDVGCMQVNLLHHPTAFASLDEAFDPMANASYAARFLNTLFIRLGNWPAAASGYHSLAVQRGETYGRLVAAHWAGGRTEMTPAFSSTMQRNMAEALGATVLDAAEIINNPIQIAQFRGGGTMQVIYVGPPAAARRK